MNEFQDFFSNLADAKDYLLITLAATYLAFFFTILRSERGRKIFIYSIRSFNRRLGQVLESILGVSDLKAYNLSDQVDRLEAMREEIARLKPIQTGGTTRAFSAKAEEQILSSVKDSLEKGLSPFIQHSITSLIKSEAHEFAKSRSIDILLDTSNQIRAASSTVAVRGFINLVIGIIFASAALLFLKQSVDLFSIQQLQQVNMGQITYFVGIRVSFAVIITLVAYFFLSLYRKSLEDVKYYQNEITFVAGKIASLSLVISTGNRESIDSAIPFLMDTDRNKIQVSASSRLKKGERDFYERMIEKSLDRVMDISPASKKD